MTPEELKADMEKLGNEIADLQTDLDEWDRPLTALDYLAYLLGVVMVAAAILFFIFI